jgi:hypothetical protein
MIRTSRRGGHTVDITRATADGVDSGRPIETIMDSSCRQPTDSLVEGDKLEHHEISVIPIVERKFWVCQH